MILYFLHIRGWKLRLCLVRWLNWHASLNTGRSKIEAAVFTPFLTIPSFTPHHFCSGYRGIKTSVYILKSWNFTNDFGEMWIFHNLVHVWKEILDYLYGNVGKFWNIWYFGEILERFLSKFHENIKTTAIAHNTGSESTYHVSTCVLVTSIFNRFFYNRLNQLSKNQFSYNFIKFNFDWSIILKSKNQLYLHVSDK